MCYKAIENFIKKSEYSVSDASRQYAHNRGVQLKDIINAVRVSVLENLKM